MAERMVGLARVAPGEAVLAAAAGNQALENALARRGAVVAASESVCFEWPDSSFDAVLGFFSVTSFANPRAVAGELKRVARPGASIVLATWSGQPWARYETAYRHFFGFPELDVTEHALEESGMAYSLVFARKP
ncbi:MAG: class I SAM-dependent methyltransferase [Thermoleophilaceae bacterium]